MNRFEAPYSFPAREAPRPLRDVIDSLAKERDIIYYTRDCCFQLESICKLSSSDRLAQAQLSNFKVWASELGIYATGHQSLQRWLRDSSSTNPTQLVKRLSKLQAILHEHHHKLRLDPYIDEDISDDSSTHIGSMPIGLNQIFNESDSNTPDVWILIETVIATLRYLSCQMRTKGAVNPEHVLQSFIAMVEHDQRFPAIQQSVHAAADISFKNAAPALRERIVFFASRLHARLCLWAWVKSPVRPAQNWQRRGRIIRKRRASSDTDTPIPSTSSNVSHSLEDLTRPDTNDGDTLTVPTVSNKSKNANPTTLPISNDRTSCLTCFKRQVPCTKERPHCKQCDRDGETCHGYLAYFVDTYGQAEYPPTPTPWNSETFSCSFCQLTCPVADIRTDSSWHNHVLIDLEPFFCLVPDCPEPFRHAESFESWLCHVEEAHNAPSWYCWHCAPQSDTKTEFKSEEELRVHLQAEHGGKLTDALISTVLKHSKIYNRTSIQDCPFCGEYPKHISAERGSKDAETALLAHIKQHFIEIGLTSLSASTNFAMETE